METALVRERYKVVRVPDAREDYTFAEAVDILDREQKACFLNIYEGRKLRVYLPCFDRMSGCHDFLGMFIEGESLVTVFGTGEGRPIDRVFFRGSGHDWRTRLAYADSLLREALNIADMPPEIGCAAMLPENVLIDQADGRVRLRFKVPPLEGTNERELASLTADQLGKILLPDAGTPAAQLDFLGEAANGSCQNVARLYGLWREWKDKIQAEYEALEKKNFLMRWLSLLWERIRRTAGRDRGEER